MVVLATLARLVCFAAGAASSEAPGEDHVCLLQTYAQKLRTSEAVEKPHHGKKAASDGVVGVGKYNDDYYTIVNVVSRRGLGEVALEFDAVGDGTWELQDPETSTISWEGGEAVAKKDVYTANDESSHIAGTLVFKGVPKDKKLSFQFGAGGFSSVDLGVPAEASDSRLSRHERTELSRQLKSKGHSSKDDASEVKSEDGDKDEDEEDEDEEDASEVEDEDVDKDEDQDQEDSESDESGTEEEEEDSEDDSTDDESEEHKPSLNEAFHHKAKHSRMRHKRDVQQMTAMTESATMTAMSASVVGALRRLENFEHQLADMQQAVNKKAATKEQATAELLASKNLRPVKPIVFIKTHRTGASTIISMLHRIGDNRDMNFMLPPVIEGQSGSPSFGWPGSFPGSNALATIGAPEHQYDVICSNAVFNSAKMLAYMKRDPFVFTVLRNPANQAVSAFEAFKPQAGSTWAERITWLKTLGHSASHGASELQISATPSKHAQAKHKQSHQDSHHRESQHHRRESEHHRRQSEHRQHKKSHHDSDNNDALAMQEARLQAQFRNPQAHDLGWYERLGGSHASDRDRSAIAEWVSSLDEELGFVLLTEHFKEGLVLLSRRLGVGLEAMAHFNMKVMAQKDTLQPPSPEEVSEVEELYPVDMALYAHFNGTFWHAWRSEGGYPAMQGEIDLLNQMNGKIAGACAKGDATLCPWRVKADDDQYVTALRQKQAGKAKV